MKNAQLIAQAMVAIITATLFLFQMAMLMASISAVGERVILSKGR
jgi:hypothetical protein